MLQRRVLHRSLLQICRLYQRSAVRNKNTGDFTSTTLSMLDDDDGQMMYIDAINTYGFRFQSGVRTIGSIALFPKSVLHWNVTSPDEINEAALTLFTILEPKLDVLILGIGARGNKISPDIIRYLRSKKINVEILPTAQAVSTFNYLNSERRAVAAGLIPPAYLPLRDNLSSASEDTIMRKEELLRGTAADIEVHSLREQMATFKKGEELVRHRREDGHIVLITKKEKEEEDKIRKQEIERLANDDSILSPLNVEKFEPKMSFREGEVVEYEHLKADPKTEKLSDESKVLLDSEKDRKKEDSETSDNDKKK